MSLGQQHIRSDSSREPADRGDALWIHGSESRGCGYASYSRRESEQMSQRPVPARGMRDLLPTEVRQRGHLLSRLVDVYERYGFQQIETPIVENIDRLIGSGGGENEKLLYKILKRGIDWPVADEASAVDLGLRYDLTVPLARFFASHDDELLMPFKSIQVGSVFRAERPQKGRYRQFTQCDIDIIGESDTIAEIELICASAEALTACEIGAFKVRLNHRALAEAIVRSSGFSDDMIAGVLITIDKIDKIGLLGVNEELAKFGAEGPVRSLTDLLDKLADASSNEVLEIVSSLPSIPSEAVDELRTIIGVSTSMVPGLSIEVDATVIRGMGYYTGAIFEVEHADSNGALGGGGRYDGMIGKLTGRQMPACGFSIGFERLWSVMADRIDVTNERRAVVLLHDRQVSLVAVNSVAQSLRSQGDIVRLEISVKNRASQLARLTAAGFTHWVEYTGGADVVPQPLTTEG